MAVEINKMSAPVELHHEEEEDDGPYYACAYCKHDRGYDFMDEMCADCYWDYDSLRKQPRRILNRMLHPENTEPQEKMEEWLNEAKQRLADFEERLAEGLPAPDTEETDAAGEAKSEGLEGLAASELHSMLDSLDQERRDYRGKTMTPADTALYDTMNQAAQAIVNELVKRDQ